MSYDLFLKPEASESPWRSFIAFFEGRANYSVSDSQVLYENEDTGVYFVFEDNSVIEQPDDEDPAVDFPIAFNINFFRPSYFALEAEPQLTAVVEQFQMTVFDPQYGGMDSDQYDAARFLAGWNKGNEAGYASFLKGQQSCHSLPGVELERIWRWNYERSQLQSQLGDGVFVPRVMFMIADGELSPSLLWPDGIPTALFPFGAVIIHRDELAPRRLFKKQPMTDLIAWRDIRSLIDENFSENGGLCLPNYNDRPDSITRFFRSLEPSGRALSQISADQVLNRELVEKYI